MNHPFPFQFPSNNNSEVNISQRQFANGRIIIATTERVLDFEDDWGTKTVRSFSMGSADCGCLATLQGMFMCELCIQRIVCSMHAAICSTCRRTVCSNCCRSAINEEDSEKPNPPATVLCLQCLEALVLERAPIVIRCLRKLFDWVRP